MSETSKFKSAVNPLLLARAVAKSEAALARMGFEVTCHDDPEGLSAARQSARASDITPLFDAAVNNLPADRFFWLKLASEQVPMAAVQAYRQDSIDTSLADWSLNFIIGTYMRRGMIMVPASPTISRTSMAHKITGNLAYHGEYWIDSRVKNRRVLEVFSKLGILLAMVKWSPDYVWALSDKTMATRGHPGRMGFMTMEAAFLQWTWAPESNGTVEWLHYIPSDVILHLITEILDYSELVYTAAQPEK